MTPIVIIVMVVFIAMLPLLFRGSFDVDPERVADVMSLEEREAIRDPALLVKCGARAGRRCSPRSSRHSVLHIEPSVVALIGAGVLILISRLETRPTTSPASNGRRCCSSPGLFIMVGALVKTGVVDELARLGDRMSQAGTRC